MLTSQPGVAEHWSVGGIPLVAFSGLFGVAGVALVVLGFVKKR